MFLKSFNSVRLFALILLCGLLAACQTSGLKPGAIQSNYTPSGWTKKTSNGITGYICVYPKCKSPRAIGYGPVRVRGDLEEAIKKNVLSRDLLNAVSNVYTVASNGHQKFNITRRIVKNEYAGFDASGYFATPGGRMYIRARVIIQDNRGSMVFSTATSQGVANSYFGKYISGMSIKRVP